MNKKKVDKFHLF